MRHIIVNLTACWCCFAWMLMSGCGETPKSPPGNAAPVVKQESTPSQVPVAPNKEEIPPADSVTGVVPESDSPSEEMPEGEEEDMEEMAEKDPSEMDREELISAMIERLQSGILKLRRDDLEEGYPAFQDAAVIANELKNRFSDLSPLERRVCSVVFFYEARALAQGEQPQDAAQAIDHAVQMGFDDFERLDSESDLAKLRDLPDYEDWRKAWEAKAAEVAASEVQQGLAEFQSYPFDFTLPDLDDNQVKLADLKGKVVVVDFWGTWCPPCREEIPSFVKLQEQYGESGLQIIGLNYEHEDDPAEAVKLIREFMDSEPINYPCLIGDEETQDQIPDFEGFPTTLFIDRAGKVRLQYIGLHSYGRLEMTVLALLNEKENDEPADANSPK